jgi:hypothetical protein
MLAYQLNRQSEGQGKSRDAAELAERLSALTLRQPEDKQKRRTWPEQRKWLKNFLTTGEFLAREIRFRKKEGEAA